ncbi:MAG: glycosyltransferase [Sulfobacillus sp.]
MDTITPKKRIKRIIVVDPSLRDNVGHHLEYDAALMQATSESGIDSLVLAHRDVEEFLPHHPHVWPTFSQDMWRNRSTLMERSVRNQVTAYRAIQLCLIIPAAITYGQDIIRYFSQAYGRVTAYARALPLRNANVGALWERFAGIYLRCATIMRSYVPTPKWRLTRNVLVATNRVLHKMLWRLRTRGTLVTAKARGVVHLARRVARNGVIVCSGLMHMLRALLARAFVYLSQCWQWPWLIMRNPAFYFELRRALEVCQYGNDDLVFCHMTVDSNLFELLLALARSRRVGGVPAAILLRYPPAFYRPGSLRGKRAFRLLEKAFDLGTLRVCSDSKRLAADFSRHTYVPIEILPIPHTLGEDDIAYPRWPAGDTPLRLASLGNARAEKGILEIMLAIDIIHRTRPDAAVEFVLQVNNPDHECAHAIAQFRTRCPSNVRIVDRAMESAEYRALLRSLDVVLVPYHTSVYASRTSGVFLEAVAAAKPVIATSGTWMADELDRYGAGIIVESGDPNALAAAIEAMLDNYSLYAERAWDTVFKCREFHSPQSLLKRLLYGAGGDVVQGKALVVYPWGNFPSLSTGSALRSGLLAQFLVDRGWSVRVGIPDCDEHPISRSAYNLLRYPSQPEEGVRSAMKLVRVLTGQATHSFDWLYFFHRFWNRTREFRLWFNAVCANCSVVFLEYTFLADVVRPFCTAYGIPLVVTSHDVLANQIHSSWLRQIVLELEANALALADHAVTVSPSDQQEFRRLGVESTLIPNSIDVASAKRLQREAADDMLHSFNRAIARVFILFVGSGHRPNFEAREFLRALAVKLKGGPQVVIAGSCASPEDSMDNFVCLGIVNHDILAALYACAGAVVIPLTSGTGTSLKTIEAMAYGCPVVGTPVAFRGYDVENGVHALIEPELDGIGRRVVDLLEDRELASTLSRNAGKFVLDYHYEATYQRYIDLLKASGVIQSGSAEQQTHVDTEYTVQRLENARRLAIQTSGGT